jgi:hypothetical protein
MTNTPLTTTITIDNWDEQPTREGDDGTKVTHAVVRLTEGKDGLSSGHMESVLYYAPDGTSSFVSLLRLEGELGGRAGAFTAIGEGTYDGTTASGAMRIIGGTGGLEGIRGTVRSDSTHEDYPHMPLVIDYALG